METTTPDTGLCDSRSVLTVPTMWALLFHHKDGDTEAQTDQVISPHLKTLAGPGFGLFSVTKTQATGDSGPPVPSSTEHRPRLPGGCERAQHVKQVRSWVRPGWLAWLEPSSHTPSCRPWGIRGSA